MDKEQLKNPAAVYRQAPFWSWNDHLDADELKRQINDMVEKGWGGYFMHSRVGLVTGYMSKEWMDMTNACAEEASKTGTTAWLYDEDRWPSGTAGGEVSKHEEYRGRSLVFLKKNEITKDDSVLQNVVTVDGDRYICKRILPMGHPRFNGTNYVDLMNPKAVREFIDCTHERYKKNCGKYFGKEIPGIFTDEPCYLYCNNYKGTPVVPWSDYLPDFFKKLKGYDITNHIKELFLDCGDYHKTRFDFYDAATRLFVESFTKQYYDWCSENKMKMTGHFMKEDDLVGQTMWIGAAMPQYEFMHWPGIDKLHRHIEQVITVKQLTSVADQLDKEKAMCEVYGCIGQQSNFYDRKWISDWEAILGINFINPHLSLYSMRGERKRDYPANLFYQQPWWDDERKFADYLGRVNYVVSNGKRKTDILIIHPISSVWSEYTPLDGEAAMPLKKGIYNKNFDSLSRKLLSENLDFHYGDEILMEKYGRVENGKLVIGNCSYSTVVVPSVFTLRKNTYKLLCDFAAEAGAGKLIILKPFAESLDGEKAEIKWPDGTQKAEKVNDVVSILDTIYENRIKIINKATGQKTSKIFVHERLSDDGEWMMIANTDNKREFELNISLQSSKKPVILDLMSGEFYSIPITINEGRAEFDIKLYPAGSVMLFFPNSEMRVEKAPRVLDSGVEIAAGYEKVELIRNLDVSLLEPNVFPINDVTLYLNDELVAKDKPLNAIWHNYFYPAPDGTPFRAEYKFEVNNIPKGEIFAAIEVAENLDSITLNGIPIKPCKMPGELGKFDTKKSWKDINFTKVPFAADQLVNGTNIIAIEGRKVNNINIPNNHLPVSDFQNHKPTEVETIYIVGDFSVVNEDNINFSIDGAKFDIDSTDLTKTGCPFYAGKAAFSTAFDYKKQQGNIYLKLNDVHTASVRLYINSQEVGLKYWTPYVFDITDYLHEGKNDIRVVASTTLFNLMGPNRMSGILDSVSVGPSSFLMAAMFTEKYSFVSFGLDSVTIYKA
ncbi:MAG: glycoside hydrolase [Bacillota bacterium]|nr:glycoside hydrolase [Bacillota bacterium]